MVLVDLILGNSSDHGYRQNPRPNKALPILLDTSPKLLLSQVTKGVRSNPIPIWFLLGLQFRISDPFMHIVEGASEVFRGLRNLRASLLEFRIISLGSDQLTKKTFQIRHNPESSPTLKTPPQKVKVNSSFPKSVLLFSTILDFHSTLTYSKLIEVGGFCQSSALSSQCEIDNDLGLGTIIWPESPSDSYREMEQLDSDSGLIASQLHFPYYCSESEFQLLHDQNWFWARVIREDFEVSSSQNSYETTELCYAYRTMLGRILMLFGQGNASCHLPMPKANILSFLNQ
ncbi:hypothetical protein VNO77_03890 [Canavalia gladiata]|uniref:Uncharacterized protein n=1 Tax=Canavalia gladiata TaxID=3824 RepID=A0AAN9R793_CANGL